jgi:ribosomal protein S17E
MRSKAINKYAKALVKKFHGSLSTDFSKNKELIQKMEPTFSKRQVNELAGYVTKIMKKHETAE